MINLNRVCIPMGMDCNFKCKYCYRDYCRNELPTELSELMKSYLQQLVPEKCESVCISGGEPLLYFNKIKEVFKYVPLNIHKKVMTNGSLLTEEIVEYFNKYNVEVLVSHDGENTAYLRGIDIFEDPELLNLVKKIKILTVSAVVTNKSNDIMAIYKYICSKLNRNDFLFKCCDLIETEVNQDLIVGFDYDVYAKSIREYLDTVWENVSYYYRLSPQIVNQRLGANVDLSGNVIGMLTLKKYGTVLNTYEECLKVKQHIDEDRCRMKNCIFLNDCMGSTQNEGAHHCKCILIRSGLD